MLGILQPDQIEKVITSGLVGRIGCHAAGETYIVPISYAYDGGFFYCITKEGKKISMMRDNPSICFQIEEMNDMANWKSVLIQGTFEEIIKPKERISAIQTLLHRYLPVISSVTTHLGEYWPFEPDDVNEIKGIVFRIAVKEKTGRFELTEQSPYIAG